MPEAAKPSLAATPWRQSDSTAGGTRRRQLAWAIGGIVLVAVMAYANSFHGEFVYDDKASILYNASIRHFADVFSPPGDAATVSGRPILNFTFAVDYAIGGIDVRGYHVTNLVIHVLAALTLFGLVRRTLGWLPANAAPRLLALPTATAVAALWVVHPLQTEAVTYIVQRAESLMTLFYFGTLYAFLRSVDSPRRRAWQAVAIASCTLGMATKENMVSAPLLVLLLDRAFVAGSLGAAWWARRGFYLALAATWGVALLLLVSTGGNRNGSAGFDVGTGFFAYGATQFPALVRYAALAFWPYPLVFDYGVFFVRDVTSIVAPILGVTAFLVVTAWALLRRPRIGTPLAAALAVLMPTSLVPGTTQMIVEHRMYLPLAALLALGVPAALALHRRTTFIAAAIAVGALALLTAARNRDYRTELSLWTDTVAKRPGSAAAHGGLGAALKEAGRNKEAVLAYRRALALNPNHVPSLSNLGLSFTEDGKPAEGIPYLERAARLNPRNAQVHINLGVTLDLLGRSQEALPHYALAVALNPMLAAAHDDYGDALARAGRLEEGMKELRVALALDPTCQASFNLAAALMRAGRHEEALAMFASGAALRPNDPGPHLSWANFLASHDHVTEALSEYEVVLRLRPDHADAHYGYATALAKLSRYRDAIPHYQAALRARPAYAEAYNNLGNTYLALNELPSAVTQYEEGLKLRPDNANAHYNLGLALARSGRIRDAKEHFAAAVRLAPDFADARDKLNRARAQLGDP
ncbi:tetratricopeptide repeat protein [Opitutus sp. ER46]|uniref:tetratricopeptide repeat protein n=1 Tax=Opitutus sp. ER46 TaxID=2161864 RepID=UPI001304D6E7|nr:tetratricopeptide repeat protein [Opitutus sp. ER46]